MWSHEEVPGLISGLECIELPSLLKEESVYIGLVELFFVLLEECACND